MNTIIIDGNLTKDPEVKTTATGKTVLNIGIANNRSIKQADGSYKDEASFFDCTFWPTNPQYWIQRLVKGARVVIEGRLEQERWEKDGQQHSRVKIIVQGYPIVVPRDGTQTAKSEAKGEEIPF